MRGRSLAVVAIMVVALAFFVVGCGEETSGNQQGQQQDSGSASGGDASNGQASGGQESGGQQGQDGVDGASAASGEQVSVGGYTIEGGGLSGTTVPEVTVDQAAAQRYLDQVRPIVQDTADDVTGSIDAQPRLEDGNLVLNLDLDAIERARNDARQGVQELQDLQTPEGLEPINQQLISSYEDVIPAYNSILEAARNGDTGEAITAVQENLPQIERFVQETNSITQSLSQAAGEQ